MRPSPAVAAFFFLLLVRAGLAGPGADSPYVPAGYERTFSAEFDDPSEAFAKTGNPRFTTGMFRLSGEGDPNTTRRLWRNGERQLYFDRDFVFEGTSFGIDPFSIRDGVLSIAAHRLSPAHRKALLPLARGGAPTVLYSSGLLSTETEGRRGAGHIQREGYWELRARLPKGKGLWSAFWLVCQTHDYWDEVDVFEVLGHEPAVIHINTHFHDGGGTEGMSPERRMVRGVDTSDGFHVYGVEILEDRLVVTVDGAEALRAPHTLEAPLYAMVNLAVGGEWPGDPDKTTVFPASLRIDYLRIYRRTSTADAPDARR